MHYFCLYLIVFVTLSTQDIHSQTFGDLKELTKYKEGVKTKRISSYDRSGGNNDRIENINPGETKEIFNVKGAGIITHIWATSNSVDPIFRRNLILRMYWDGETVPSVQSPIGDFFGQGWGEFYNFSSLPLAASPRRGRAMVCYFPMPFANGARITIENDSEFPVECFYYYVDYEEYPKLDLDVLRFHAWWNHKIEKPAPDEPKVNITGEYNHILADIKGKGQYVGTNYYINSPTVSWYGEGDDMFFIDGEKWPSSLHGTGTEDYFNQAFGMPERFDHPYYGLARLQRGINEQGRVHAYRFHIQDPIRFSKSLLATIEHGHNNGYPMEMSTVAYWYQSEPHKTFPEIPDRKERIPVPEEDFMGYNQPWWTNMSK